MIHKYLYILPLIIFLICLSCSDESTAPEKTDTMTDIDGNIYQTIKIGNQWWMAENLKVTHYRNGEEIQQVTEDSIWANLNTGAYCNYKNDITYVATYGRLYNWYTVVDYRTIAPNGWHVPSDDEWKELEMYIGMSQEEADKTVNRGTNEGGKLKEEGTKHWDSPNTDATNEYGFCALPAGYRDYYGQFGNLGWNTGFWTSTEWDTNLTAAYYRNLDNYNSEAGRDGNLIQTGYSVRCVKD